MTTIACRGEHCPVAARQAIRSWDYADPNAESAGGYLATSTSAAEDSSFVRSSACPIPGGDWTGLTDSQAVMASP
jgi:hypothetical protein